MSKRIQTLIPFCGPALIEIPIVSKNKNLNLLMEVLLKEANRSARHTAIKSLGDETTIFFGDFLRNFSITFLRCRI